MRIDIDIDVYVMRDATLEQRCHAATCCLYLVMRQNNILRSNA